MSSSGNKITRSEIRFKVNINHGKFTDQRKFNFIIYHNLPNIPGLRIEDALDNWTARTRVFTANAFCKYILSKNTGCMALTEEEFKALKDEE